MGIKMLLPMELRHAFRESAAFFQEALDKQNLVERPTWTGPMLYDPGNARLQACSRGFGLRRASPRLHGTDPDAGEAGAAAGAAPLLDLFAPDVAPGPDRGPGAHAPALDAFKMLYQRLSSIART